MSIYSNKVGLHNVGSYMVSGAPWVTGSASDTELASGRTIRYQFPHVTKSFTVINIGGGDIRVHFQKGDNAGAISSDGGAGVTNSNVSSDSVQSKHHYITVPANNGSVTFEVKCAEIYISNHSLSASGYEIIADLTHIPSERMYSLTGSGIET